MKLRQYKLRHKCQEPGLENAYAEMTVWLEDERANVGDRVTLKDSDEPEREWEIVEAYSSQDHGSINRTNNFGKSIKGRGSLED